MLITILSNKYHIINGDEFIISRCLKNTAFN